MRKKDLNRAVKNYRDVLEGMEFRNLDDLAKETRDCRSIGELAISRIKSMLELIEKLKSEKTKTIKNIDWNMKNLN